jgi:hypothetical protein
MPELSSLQDHKARHAESGQDRAPERQARWYSQGGACHAGFSQIKMETHAGRKDGRKMKVVVNRCYGGFGISKKAAALYQARTGAPFDIYIDNNRSDPVLVAIVEELGKEADGKYSALEVVEIPDGIEWKIEEYDGMEWVSEAHRTW